ncbi:MAG: macro domain-containing protein [Methylococcaceae bacterium]|jgi:O-acetyl-ADP-ribose deacetylase (regulator of RNase III)|nr:macro domain-containing protein [Methylococcaceae bacterium]MDZ4157426.1 macro domain-containing protein [Methylococcales bacterium]MDP2393659.1 macro domain-containing protein [Methylococcaceae bacterium]MDP3020705.1 macro domain-containing protein [Methylococcaceae bacterium]MDP3390452.1 macro domain-containing protein [Methylococcaceae bacterium]
MIFQVEGDILLSKAQAVAHGVKINDPMDKGLALALHNQYPGMHKDFHHWCHQHHPEPGDAWIWGGVNGIRIINLITQEGIDGHDHRLGKATLTIVNHALRALVKIIEHEKINSLALPKLATGIGGLEWDDVWPLIDSHLGKLDIPVYLYTTYHANHQAQEPNA